VTGGAAGSQRAWLLNGGQHAGLAGFGLSLSLGLLVRARLGPGPRDGLMTGIVARGHSRRTLLR